MRTETIVDESTGQATRGSRRDDASDAPLPIAYGIDRLVLMVRDPTSAHAYWDISADRITEVVGSPDGGRALLRLIGLETGYLLSEQQVAAERGSANIPLPEPDRSYAVELAIVHYGCRVVLARSNVIQAPASSPRHLDRLAFVGRSDQRRALELGLTLDSRVEDWAGLLPVSIRRVSITQGSEARLARFGSEFAGFGFELPGFGSEVAEFGAEHAGPGSEHRLAPLR